MQSHGIEMIVLVKNRAISEYQHNNQFFIEGRYGSNYEIEIRNHTPARVQVILSVDGLSVIDGEPAGGDSRGYLIEANAVLRVPGWLLDGQSAAQFTFAERRDSYAAQTNDGQTHNVGVIGVLAYREKVVPAYNPFIPNWYTGIAMPNYSMPMYNAPNTPNYTMPMYTTSSTLDLMNNAVPRGVNSAPFVGSVSVNNAAATASAAASPTMGTAFGAQTQFATRAVSFERGEQLTVMSLFYDSLKGLRAKGVPVERRGRDHQRMPEAFPELRRGYAKAPHGWRNHGSLSGIV